MSECVFVYCGGGGLIFFFEVGRGVGGQGRELVWFVFCFCFVLFMFCFFCLGGEGYMASIACWSLVFCVCVP